MSGTRPSDQGQAVWGFFAMALGWSWVFWGLALFHGGDAWRLPNLLFIVLGGLGPALSGILMTFCVRGRAGLGELYRRLTDVRRISAGWYAVILLLMPATNFIALFVAVGEEGSTLSLALANVQDQLTHPLDFLLLAGFILLFGPLPEEIGWRGYALDPLQARWSALTASLVLGAFWGVWHAPLFFMQAYYGPDSAPEPFRFFYNILLASILLTWIHNNTRRSLLAAILFHFSINFAGELLPLSDEADVLKTILMTATTGIVVLVWGPHRLRRQIGMTVERRD